MFVICYKVVSFDTEITSDSEEVIKLAQRMSDTEGHGSPADTSRIFGDVLDAVADFARIPERLWLGTYGMVAQDGTREHRVASSPALLPSTSADRAPAWNDILETPVKCLMRSAKLFHTSLRRLDEEG